MNKDQFLHIHICVGSLGLSLPIPVISNSLDKDVMDENKSILINRRKLDSSDERYKFFDSLHKNQRYFLSYMSMIKNENINIKNLPKDFQKNDHKRIKEEVKNFILIENDIDELLPLSNKISGKNLFITLSPNGKGRNYAIRKLKEFLSMADTNCFIFVASCENGNRVSSKFYSNAHEIDEICNRRNFKHLYFLDCVIDRMVPENWVFEEHSKNVNNLYINTEEYFKWTIEYPIWNNKEDESKGIVLLENLFKSKLNEKIKFIKHGEYEKEYYLKTFCVNGLHYAIAILQEYIFIKQKIDQENVNLVLDKNNPLHPSIERVIFNLKKASVNMIASYNRSIGKVEEMNEVEKYVDRFMSEFLDRLKLLDDNRNRIIKPLMRLANKSEKIWTKLNDAPLELKEKVFNLVSTGEKDFEKKLVGYFEGFSKIVKEYESFMNLYEFEDKLICRILQPINYYRFNCCDKNLLDEKDPTCNIELERVSLIAHHVITDVCFRSKMLFQN